MPLHRPMFDPIITFTSNSSTLESTSVPTRSVLPMPPNPGLDVQSTLLSFGLNEIEMAGAPLEVEQSKGDGAAFDFVVSVSFP